MLKPYTSHTDQIHRILTLSDPAGLLRDALRVLRFVGVPAKEVPEECLLVALLLLPPLRRLGPRLEDTGKSQGERCLKGFQSFPQSPGLDEGSLKQVASSDSSGSLCLVMVLDRCITDIEQHIRGSDLEYPCGREVRCLLVENYSNSRLKFDRRWASAQQEVNAQSQSVCRKTHIGLCDNISRLLSCVMSSLTKLQ